MATIRALYDKASDPADPRRRPVGYEVRYRDGNGRQRTKGGFRRKRDADAYLTELEGSRQRGVLIPHSAGAARLEVVARAWLGSITTRRKPRTVDGYRMLLESHVVPAFGQRKVGSITYADVDGFVRSLEASGRRSGTVRNAFYVFKMVLDFAVKDGRINGNPCVSVELPSAASPEMLFLTAEQVRVLAEELDLRAGVRAGRAPATGTLPYGLLVEFAAFTGLRAGEISALRNSALDLQQGALAVYRSASTLRGQRIEGDPKTKAGKRTVFVNKALADRLRQHLGRRIIDRDGYVFVDAKGQPLNYGTFYGLYFKPAVRAVLPEHLHRLRFHDLRHTFASLLVAQGAHPKEMAELMGHSSVQITLDRYSHVMPHLTRLLADRMDAVYLAADPRSAGHPNGSDA